MFSGNRSHNSNRGWTTRCAWLMAALLLLLTGCNRKPEPGPPGESTPTSQASAASKPASKEVNTLDPNVKYAVYYYDQANKVLLVEILNPPHDDRSANTLTGSEPTLAPVCDSSFPSKPANCQGDRCPVSVTAVSAVYYGPGNAAEDGVKAVGVEQGPFVGRSIDWAGGSGCSPTCSKKCCAPVVGGCRCIC